MTRRLTVLFSLFEAVLVAGIGIAIPLVPLTVLWAVQYGFGPDWLIFWRASVDVWLVGHGVDLRLVPDATIAAALGGDADPVPITMAALGFALLTLLLGALAGTRIAETGHRALGTTCAVVVFGVISAGVTSTSLLPTARPSLWQGALLPTGVFLLGILIPVVVGGRVDGVSGLARVTARWSPRVRALAAAVARSGLGAAAITLLASAVAVTVLILGHYAQIIRLYESLHAGWAGSLAVTAGQLAILPNLVVWAASWFTGPGFALGTGSSVSPLGTAVGPLPGIPLLGAVPEGELAFGFVGLAVPVIAGFLAGVGSRPALVRGLDGGAPGWRAVPIALAGGALGGVVLGLLAWASAGSAGPGRFVRLGPDPVTVGCWSALELALGIAIGLAVAGVRRTLGTSRPRDTERGAPSRPAVPARTGPAEHDSVDTAPLETVPPRPR